MVDSWRSPGGMRRDETPEPEMYRELEERLDFAPVGADTRPNSGLAALPPAEASFGSRESVVRWPEADMVSASAHRCRERYQTGRA